MRYALVALALLLPTSALAASATSTFAAARDLAVVAPAKTNAYYAAGSLTVSAPTLGDLSAAAGSIIVASAVLGDADLAGGIIALRAPVSGDLRAAAGRLSIDSPVAGDLVAFAGSFADSAGGERDALIIAGTADVLGGSAGPITIYGNDVSLAGDFAGNVKVVASGHISVLSGTRIHGTLDYEAPEEAAIDSSAVITGGAEYTGASFLPTAGESRAITLAGVGIFLLVKILGALILAGLFAGLFPGLAEAVAREAFASARRVILTALLGFGVLVATPVLLLLLALTFVGLGLAAVLGSAYLLLAFLALIYTGILVGAALAHTFAKRESILWRDAVLGMFVVCLLTIVPVVGLLCVGILWASAAGALSRIFYRFAFPREESTAPLL